MHHNSHMATSSFKLLEGQHDNTCIKEDGLSSSELPGVATLSPTKAILHPHNQRLDATSIDGASKQQQANHKSANAPTTSLTALQEVPPQGKQRQPVVLEAILGLGSSSEQFCSRKRKHNFPAGSWVDPATITYNPNAWFLLGSGGHLQKKTRPSSLSSISVPAKLVHPNATPTEWLVEKASPTFVSNKIAQITYNDLSTPTDYPSTNSCYQDKIQLQDEQGKKAYIRIGEDYQACLGDYCPCFIERDSSSCKDLGGGPDQLWDPLQASQAKERGEKIDEFIAQGKEFNVTILLMQALHSSGYCVKLAMKEFIRLYNANPDISVTLSESQEKEFENLYSGHLLGTKKNFKETASRLGVCKESVMVNYYKQKGSQKVCEDTS